MNDSFDIKKFMVSTPSFYAIKGNGRTGILAHTEFYSIPIRFLSIYKEHFKVWLDKNTTEPMEHIFTMFLECLREVNRLDVVGVSGYGANTEKFNCI